MALFNYATKEITLKIVYYGPGLSGKTTNLQYLHTVLNPETKGKLLSLATESDRTLFFDFLPIKLGKIRDFSIRFQLYTVPGQVRYNSTRKIVLKGADGVVFVADSQSEMSEQNVESFMNMRDNLSSNNINPDEIPIVFQYNKRDLKNISTIEELSRDLNSRNYPVIESSAIKGIGVEDSFNLITRLILKNISKRHQIEIKTSEKDEETRPVLKGSKPDFKRESNPEIKSAFNLPLKPDLKPEINPEIKPDSDLDLKSKPELNPDIKPIDLELRPDIKADAAPEFKPGSGPDYNLEINSEVKTETPEIRPSPDSYPPFESLPKKAVELPEEQIEDIDVFPTEEPTAQAGGFDIEKTAERTPEFTGGKFMEPEVEIPLREHIENTAADLWPPETKDQPDARSYFDEPEIPVSREPEKINVFNEIREVPVIPAEKLDMLISELKSIHEICRDLKKSVSMLDPEKGLKELKKEQEKATFFLRDILTALSEKKKRKRGFRLW